MKHIALLISTFLLFKISFCEEIIYVPTDFSSIQSAIDNSTNGDTILVLPGTYYENDISFNGNDIYLIAQNNTSPTIIDGNNIGRIFNISNGESFNCVIDGFTLTNGFSSVGSAIYIINDSYLTVKNCTISNNSSSGIWTRPAISLGHAYNNGLHSEAAIKMYNCVIENNSSYYGGAVFNEESGENQSIFENCIFRNNLGFHGAAIFGTRNSIIKKCQFYSNVVGNSSSGVLQNFGGPTIINCTFTENDGAIISGNNSDTTRIINSIFYNNSGSFTQISDFGLIHSSYSLFEDYNDCFNCLSGDPDFMNPSLNDFSLNVFTFL